MPIDNPEVVDAIGIERDSDFVVLTRAGEQVWQVASR